MHHTYHTFMTRSHNVSYFLCNFIVVRTLNNRYFLIKVLLPSHSLMSWFQQHLHLLSSSSLVEVLSRETSSNFVNVYSKVNWKMVHMSTSLTPTTTETFMCMPAARIVNSSA